MYRLLEEIQKFSAIGRDTKFDLHRSKVNVSGAVHYFLKVQSYHKNSAIEKFHFFS